MTQQQQQQQQQPPRHSIRFAILILAFSLVLPSIVKFTHAFAHHKHEVCLGEPQAHLHKVDLDCDFYKFKTHNEIYFTPIDYHFFSVVHNHKPITTRYLFLSDYQGLYFALRAPPFNS